MFENIHFKMQIIFSILDCPRKYPYPLSHNVYWFEHQISWIKLKLVLIFSLPKVLTPNFHKIKKDLALQILVVVPRCIFVYHSPDLPQTLVET